MLLAAFNANALIDQELNESRKCSNHFSYFEKKLDIPKDTLHSISLQETKRKHSKSNVQLVWPWTVNVKGVGYHFSSRDEAIEFTKKKQSEGITSIDVGCMQINLKYHPEAFASLEQAFSPRRNIAYGAKHLKEKYNSSGNWNKAIGHYHSYNKVHSQKYSDNVSRFADSMDDYRVEMNKLKPSQLFEVSSANDRFVASNDEIVMPNEIKNSKKERATTQKKSDIKVGNVAVGRLTQHHWFRQRDDSKNYNASSM